MKDSYSGLAAAVRACLLLLLVWSLQGCQQEGGSGHSGGNRMEPSGENMLEYYAAHSAMTDPKGSVDLYEGLPSDPKRIVAAVQGVFVHGGLTWLYKLKPRDEQNEGWKVRQVADMLERIRRLDGRGLTARRELKNRLVVNCRQFAVLTCSIFRHHGIPARARAGYATYTWGRGKYENHWICEYWSAVDRRWVQVDAQIDQKQRKLMKIDFDTLDMPKGKFMAAGTGWKLCRGWQACT